MGQAKRRGTFDQRSQEARLMAGVGRLLKDNMPTAGTPVTKLTDLQKVSLIYHAGVHCQIHTGDGRVDVSPIQPCHIELLDTGKYRVTIQAQPAGEPAP